MRVTQSLNAVHAEVRKDILALVGLGLAALALGLVVAWVLAGFLSRPLRGLTAAARRVEAGDLDARADEAGAREHREVAHAFNDMTARLGQSMAAQRDFVANAAHQLRTPLTGLRLRLEAAGLKTDDEALRRDLEAGEREAERLARTVTDLLTLAREGQRPAAVAPLDLAAAGEAALERWLPVADEHGVELDLRDGSAGARVDASAEDVAVILDNLIENAIEHTAPRTTVVVELGADAPGPHRRLRRRARPRRRARRSASSSASSAAARAASARAAAASASPSCACSPAAGAATRRSRTARRAARARSCACRSRRAADPADDRAHSPPSWRTDDRPRQARLLAALAILGVLAAFGIGLAANAISGDTVGLSARPLAAGESLAPAEDDRSGRDGGAQTTTTTTPRRTTTTSTSTTPTDDDHGARRRQRRALARRSGSGSGGGDDSGSGRGRGRGRGGDD